SITVDETTVIPQNDFHPAQPVWVRRFASPILGGGSTYTAVPAAGFSAASTYNKESTSSFGPRVLALQRVARFTIPQGGAPASLSVPVFNARLAASTMSVSTTKSWITAVASVSSMAAEQ